MFFFHLLDPASRLLEFFLQLSEFLSWPRIFLVLSLQLGNAFLEVGCYFPSTCSGFVQTVPRFPVLRLQFCRPLFCFLMFFFHLLDPASRLLEFFLQLSEFLSWPRIFLLEEAGIVKVSLQIGSGGPC